MEAAEDEPEAEEAVVEGDAREGKNGELAEPGDVGDMGDVVDGARSPLGRLAAVRMLRDVEAVEPLPLPMLSRRLCRRLLCMVCSTSAVGTHLMAVRVESL